MRRSSLMIFAVALAFSGAAFTAAAAPPKTPAVHGESDKKPGKDCSKLQRNTDAYKDCIAARAHDDKPPGSKGKGKGSKTP